MKKMQSLLIGVIVVSGIGWIVFSYSHPKKTNGIAPDLYNKTDPYAHTGTQSTTNNIPTIDISQQNTDNTFFLTIMDPQDNISVTSSTISVKGKTMPDAEVFVNDKELIADKQGEFNVPVELGAGENEIMIFANDTDGNVADKTLHITYNP